MGNKKTVLFSVKVSPRWLSVPKEKKTMAKMEQRLKCANFCIFVKRERFMMVDGSP